MKRNKGKLLLMDFLKEFNKCKNNSKSKKRTFVHFKIPNRTNFIHWLNHKQSSKSKLTSKMSS